MPCPVTIDALEGDSARPFWSVMIPTYNASEFLESTLRSVLDQDPGPAEMQIALVDDCSTGSHAEELVRGLAPGRVEFHRNPLNVGLARNWNSCVSRARGHLVHILHQDDLVRPQFYDLLGQAARKHPEVGLLFCRHEIIDEDGIQLSMSGIERDTPGVIDDWVGKIAVSQRIQCPSVVVRRSVYETVGGFRPDLVYTLDWEMWVRIAAQFPVWFEPSLLACYRSHGQNETARLKRSGMDLIDHQNGIAIIAQSLPKERSRALTKEALLALNPSLFAQAANFMHAGDWRSGMNLVFQACRNDPTLFASMRVFNYLKWFIKIRMREVLRPSDAS